MLGQPAAWQTVCRPSRFTSPCSCVNSGPIVALTLIHGGLRSIGVCAFRASMRSIRRPSGAAEDPVDGTAEVTPPAYVALRSEGFQRDTPNTGRLATQVNGDDGTE